MGNLAKIFLKISSITIDVVWPTDNFLTEVLGDTFKIYSLMIVSNISLAPTYTEIYILSDVRDRTLSRIILVHLTPGCRKETLDVASRVLLKGIVEKLAIHCCQYLSNLIRGRSHI